MKSYFTFDIRGGNWWLPILAYWLVAVGFNVPIQLMSLQKSTQNTGAIFALLIVFMFALAVTISLVSIAILRIIFAKLSVASHTFAFRGSMGRFLGMNLLGAFLSMITLGIYIPWWLRRAFAYLLSETKVDARTLEFYGRGGTLFKYLLLCVYVPMILFIGALVLFGIMSAKSGGGSPTTVTLLVLLFYIVFLIALMFFVYLNYKWLVQIRWNGRTILWKTDFWKSVGMIVGQTLLSIVTVFIYLPAASLRLYRYFTARTVMLSADSGAQPEDAASRKPRSGTQDAGDEIGHLGFDGPLGRGFLVIWGQLLLTIITIGIYLPWAYARIFRWVAKYTYYEPTAEKVPQTVGAELPS